MFTVLIADDEPIIRRGIRKLVDWESLGFCIIGETGDGLSTLEFILKNNPQLVLLDIKMPAIDGLEVVRRARAAGYNGKVIILSGYSDFTYAQEALRYNVNDYIRKPVESKLLEQELTSLSEQINQEISEKQALDLYKQKASDAILKEILLGTCNFSQIDLADLRMDTGSYQVVIYEKFHQDSSQISYDFSELLRVANKNQNSFSTIILGSNEVIVLKSEHAVLKFKEFLEHYERDMKPQKGSPLDSLFITYGRVVNSVKNIRESYLEAKQLLQRRFFCKKGQHTLGYEELDSIVSNSPAHSDELMEEYTCLFSNYIQAANRNGLINTIEELTEKLYFSSETADSIKLFMTDLLLQIKEKITHIYTTEVSFSTNSQIINAIRHKHYLYEITAFFLEQFDKVLKASCLYTKQTTIDNVIYFIENNYQDNIRLETIATAFGYNTSYLGQLFNEKMGCCFNTYLDKIRIEKACELLADPALKVYDVAELVGYRSVDYFHLKFKKQMHVSPLEYRRSKTQTS
ncbi:MAG: response regulator [Lachnospiraceae bacterium]